MPTYVLPLAALLVMAWSLPVGDVPGPFGW